MQTTDNFGRTVEEAEPRYFPVSLAKFILLSIATFGLYELYWFYRNWHYIKSRDHSDIWPFWRAFFANCTCYFLIADVQKNSGAKEQGLIGSAGLIAVAYFLVLPTWRLPDPWWLISSFSFVPLLPILNAINSINGRNAVYTTNSRILWYQYAFLLVFIPLVAATMGSALRLFPPIVVIEGNEIPAWHQEWMLKQGLLSENEEILYFYSTGFFSYRVDGNLITDQAAISYWQDAGELYSVDAHYDDIESIDVEYGDLLNDTQIRVNQRTGDWFVLFASAEEGLDREFVAALQSKLSP